MLLLLLGKNEERCALFSESVIEVVPMISVARQRAMPEHMVGLIEYRGGWVPVIDLTERLQGRNSATFMSTRIVIVDYPHESTRLLGLIAEHVTDTVKLGEGDIRPCPPHLGDGPYLGAVEVDDRVVPVVDVRRLLPRSDARAIFSTAREKNEES